MKNISNKLKFFLLIFLIYIFVANYVNFKKGFLKMKDDFIRMGSKND